MEHRLHQCGECKKWFPTIYIIAGLAYCYKHALDRGMAVEEDYGC